MRDMLCVRDFAENSLSRLFLWLYLFYFYVISFTVREKKIATKAHLELSQTKMMGLFY